MDNKIKKGKADRTRINVSEEYELDYWSNKFGVRRKDIKTAVIAVGDNALKVEAYIKQRFGK